MEADKAESEMGSDNCGDSNLWLNNVHLVDATSGRGEQADDEDES